MSDSPLIELSDLVETPTFGLREDKPATTDSSVRRTVFTPASHSVSDPFHTPPQNKNDNISPGSANSRLVADLENCTDLTDAEKTSVIKGLMLGRSIPLLTGPPPPKTDAQKKFLKNVAQAPATLIDLLHWSNITKNALIKHFSGHFADQ